MSSSEDLCFTIDLHGKDFILNTGVPSHKLDDSVVDKITKCKGEYSPERKGFIIPIGELCNLLDECFDYFTEESLVHISDLLEKNGADVATKERVREKSVSKNKSKKKLELPAVTREDIEKHNRKEEERLSKKEEDRFSKKEEERLSKKEEDRFSKKEESDRLSKKEEERQKSKKDDEHRHHRREEMERLSRIEEEKRRHRVREEENAFDFFKNSPYSRGVSRSGSPSRLKSGSPSRFRLLDETARHAFDDTLRREERVKKSVNFDPPVRVRDDDTRREIFGAVSQLKLSVSEITNRMSRLEQMVSKYL
jgi:hypothetical protein